MRSRIDAIARVTPPVMADVIPMRPAPKKTMEAGRYRMISNAKKNSGEIWLYGTIGATWFGDGVTAKQFADDLKKLGKVDTIDLRINSDGGVVTDARAMYNLLVQHEAKIITHIDGIAASAASFIAMAGNEIEIAEGGFVMIHNARGGCWGEAVEMRRYADILEEVNVTIRETYAARTKNTDAQLKSWMDEEKWFSGKDAVANRFADRVVPNLAVAASLHDPGMFKNLPAALRPNRLKAMADLAAMRATIEA